LEEALDLSSERLLDDDNDDDYDDILSHHCHPSHVTCCMGTE